MEGVGFGGWGLSFEPNRQSLLAPSILAPSILAQSLLAGRKASRMID